MKCFDHKSGKYAEIHNAKIYYEEIGDNDQSVLLMLHGGLGNIEHFNSILPYIPEKFRVIGIDSCGQGKSSLGSNKLTYKLLQEEVEYILQILNIKRLSIIGFSNGGTIAYRLAAFTQLQIDHLITVGSPWNTKHLEPIMPAFSKITTQEWISQSTNDYEKYQELNPDANIDKIFREVMNLALDKSRDSRPNDNVKNITCPLLAARGESDPIISDAHIEELSRLVKNTSILNIPSAGHEAIHDQPKFFADKLLKFIGIS